MQRDPTRRTRRRRRQAGELCNGNVTCAAGFAIEAAMASKSSLRARASVAVFSTRSVKAM
jgi:hypothetical protein